MFIRAQHRNDRFRFALSCRDRRHRAHALERFQFKPQSAGCIDDPALDIDALSNLVENMAQAAEPAEPDMDLTEAVEMDSLEALAEAEADETAEDEE